MSNDLNIVLMISVYNVHLFSSLLFLVPLCHLIREGVMKMVVESMGMSHETLLNYYMRVGLSLLVAQRKTRSTLPSNGEGRTALPWFRHVLNNLLHDIT